MFRALRLEMQRNRPQIIFLAETKIGNDIMQRIKSLLGFECCFSVDCVGKSGGLALLWNSESNLNIVSFSKGHIDSLVQGRNGTWRFTCFYGSPKVEERPSSWTLLKRLKTLYDYPWIVGGDFNEIMS